jgi:hypothetical protein
MNSPNTAPAGGTPSTPTAAESETKGTAWTDKVKTIGGLVAVAVGVVVVGLIAIVALIKDTQTASTIASSAGGVIATIVGAYFGVKVGADQSKTAIENSHAESAKAQVYAAHLPSGDARDIVERAEKAAADVLKR